MSPMKPGIFLSLALAVTVAASAAETFDQAVQKAALEYAGRQRQASQELNAARAKIAADKAPLLNALRTAEDRLIAAQQDLSQRTAAHEKVEETRHHLQRDAETLQRNRAYLDSLAQDGLKAYVDGALPAEGALQAEAAQALQHRLDTPAGPEGRAAGEVAEFLLARIEGALGGGTATGTARFDDDNQVLPGAFAFVGPQVYFRADSGRAGLVLRPREDAAGPVAVVHALREWAAPDAAAYFQGQPGALPADPTVGKALRLQEAKGDLVAHINKGGLVAYAIVGVGLLALLLIVMKTRDVIALGVDREPVVRGFLARVAGDDPAEAARALPALKSATRELFTVGLKHRAQPKDELEEHLQAVLLHRRLFAERRLPLLAVIATASPLMGLLGTVVGMVRTFALITVFGTGNAGKLAGGISEVLVATELGLMVAIPTLVAHGFLAHRIHKKLAMLESYALEFVTAAKSDDPVVPAGEDARA